MFGQFYKFEDFEFICHGLFFIFGQIFVDQFTEDMGQYTLTDTN